MKQIITSALAIALIFISSNINGQSWLWAKSNGGSSNDAGNSITVDAAGNSYITGSYSSPTITFGSTTFTNTGGLDMFVVKYDPSGNVVWAKSGKGVSNEVGYNIAVDGSGNTYVVGTYNSASFVLGTFSLTLGGFDDIFIVKYDASGNEVWAKRAGGSGNDIGQNISVDASGNSYITGYFASSSITFGSNTLTNSGGNDFYTAKYDAMGNVVWAKSAGGSSNDSGMGIVVDASGNTYVTGSYSSSTIMFGSTTFTNTGGLDLFTVKYDASGNVVWAKSATGSSNDIGYNIKLDASGNPYLVGNFNSSTLTIGSTALTLAGFDDLFIVKYDPSGNVLWAKRAGGANNDIAESISIDSNGNSYITGYFASASLTFGSTTLTNTGTNNTFVAAYDVTGNVLWAKQVGGTSDDRGNSIAIDASGNNAYVTGYFTSSTISFSASTLTNVGNNDIFVAKLGIATTGINEKKEQSIYSMIVPNPNNGIFELRIMGIQNSDIETQISVTNTLGQLVFENNPTSQTVNIKLENAGVYFVTVKAGSKVSISKVVVN